MTRFGQEVFGIMTNVTALVAAPLCAGACATPSQTDQIVMSAPTAAVHAAAETEAVGTANADAADDPAIWAAPAGALVEVAGRPVPGFIAGTDKKAGLHIFGLDGRRLQFIPDGLLNNVDLRDGVIVDGRPQVVIAASDRGRMGVALYLYDPAGQGGNAVRPWGFIRSDVVEPYGFCMGLIGGVPHAILIAKDGGVRQYRIEAGPNGGVGTEVRRFAVGTQSEGCVVDDRAGYLYIGEEDVGVWRYRLDPASGDARIPVQPVDASGRLVADVEGMTLLRDGSSTYLIVSSQGDSAFSVWRVDEAIPAYRGRFRVAAANGIDGVTGTDGIDARGGPVGPYPEGLVVVQDDQNEGAQNFKLIDWREIRRALGLGG